MAKIAPYTFWQSLDNNGDPLSNGKLYTYAAGTSTPKQTFTDSTESATNTNPIILDANGRADIWLDTGAYKFVLDDENDVQIAVTDNITGAAENVFGSSVEEVSSNTNVTEAFKNTIIVCTSALTLSLLDAASALEGFIFSVKNESSGDVIIDPDGLELINGASTYIIKSGASAFVACDGTGWLTLFAEGLRISENDTATGLFSDKVTAGGSIDFTVSNDGADENVAISLSDMDEATIKGRSDGSGTGAPEDLTGAQVATIIGAPTETTSGVVEKATSAEVIAETVDKYIDAALIKYNEGVAKVSGTIDGTGTASITRNHNIASIVDNGTGSYTVNLAVTMSDANYSVAANAVGTGLAGVCVDVRSKTTTSFEAFTFTNQTPALVDTTFSFAIYGDLA